MVYTFPSVLLRSPLQSLKKVYRFSDNTTPLFEEGLYLSSPEFWAEFQKKETLSFKEKDKLNLSLAKYHIRSCSRCTPYGTFAGSTLLNISEGKTAIVINSETDHKRQIRVDMNYMTRIINALIGLPYIRNQIKLFANNSIYELPYSFRYVQYFIKNNQRYYDLTSVEKTDYLSSIIKIAESGATISQLADHLVSIEKVDYNEALDFITSLCDSQLLISDLEPCVTGSEPLDRLINQVELLNDTENLVTQLKKIQLLIKKPEPGVACYQNIESEIHQLGINADIPRNTLQTDLFLSTAINYINQETIKTIVDQFEEWSVFAKVRKIPLLEDFKARFIAKYEMAEMPLALVLDVESGIGYNITNQNATGEDDLINDIEFKAGAANIQIDNLQRYILSKYHDYLEKGLNDEVIVITEKELSKFKDDDVNHTYANSFYLFGSLIKSKDDDPTKFDFDLVGIAGPSACNMMARFTHGDEKLLELTREILKEEAKGDPDAIYAEFAHFPQARMGNVLLRPVLREYEIPYVGKSGIAPENQIPVSDIMVSVRNDEVVLRSKKYNRRIIPRLTTAHNFRHQALPLYSFLGDLQTQKISMPALWDWGMLSFQDHLPRVVYKNLIIKKAQWRIDENKIKDLPVEKAEYPEYFKKLRRQYKIPQRVQYVESDNKLLIDFDTPEGIDLFLQYLSRYKAIIVEEFLFTEENCIVKDIGGDPYTSELVIPLSRKKENPKTIIGKTATSEPIRRKFSVYSEWLYFKIYCGHATAEKILKNEISNFVESGFEHKLFEKFFFLRYRDELPHIRIRFYNREVDRNLQVQKHFMEMLQPLLDNEMIEKVVLDSYVREIERYGADTIKESEDLFFNDSIAVLRFIDLLEGEATEKYRMLFGLRGIDMLLSDFHYTTTEKTALLKVMQAGYFKEFGGQPNLEKKLNDKYRKNQKEIFSHLNPEFDEINEISEGVEVFRRRSELNRRPVSDILKKINGDSRQRDELLKSYIHMFINRLFTNSQRKYELVIYHFAERYYTSQLAIAKKGKIKQDAVA